MRREHECFARARLTNAKLMCNRVKRCDESAAHNLPTETRSFGVVENVFAESNQQKKKKKKSGNVLLLRCVALRWFVYCVTNVSFNRGRLPKLSLMLDIDAM